MDYGVRPFAGPDSVRTGGVLPNVDNRLPERILPPLYNDIIRPHPAYDPSIIPQQVAIGGGGGGGNGMNMYEDEEEKVGGVGGGVGGFDDDDY